MKLIRTFVFCLCIIGGLQAQNVKILDQSTNEPIPGVTVYNAKKTKSVISNIDGKVSLDQFNSRETIYFQSILYVKVATKKLDIASNQYIVLMVPNIENLNQVVISASKFEQSKRDIPQTIVNIISADIQFENPQTSADLLEGTGNIFIQKSQLGGGSPMIRGFSTNRLLITVDGVRMNNAIF
ncbi:MAG: TonB-dependent receptor plug domain-containing protein, partial [Psychroserpens sp.]|nr:TonB-dependent receptor plug domain-containing protein [Psychroserpens sp.]